MNQLDLLNGIKKYLARFESHVKIAAGNSEYDINIHSENVIIPVLNLLYHTKFKNANIAEKNAKGIDLVNENHTIFVQITSTKTIEKIKNTLVNYIDSKYYHANSRVIIYILSGKNASYSKEAIEKKISEKLEFNVESDIIDNSSIYKMIKDSNDLELIKKIESLLQKQFVDFNDELISEEEYDIFIKDYTNSCINNFARINFFGLSVSKKPREVELFELFVSPILKQARNNEFLSSRFNSFIIESTSTTDIELKDIYISKDFVFPDLSRSFPYISTKAILSSELYRGTIGSFDNNSRLDFKDLFNKEGNIVILGKPGAGKSSLVKFAISKILKKDESVFSNKKIYSYLPFRIELHKYSRYKKDNGGNMTEFLRHTLKSEYNISIQQTKLIEIIANKKCIFFFDGLDEIFDIQERIDARNDIENYTKLNSNIKSIVTSRYESYEEVRLNSESFYILEVLDFNNDQINEYVEKWYTLEESIVTLRKNEIKNCIQQLAAVNDELKRNPLLLSLILILYRNELEIPTSKLDIYESCTNTIVETRDGKEKKLEFNLKISNKTSVFASLAYWQFNNETTDNSKLITYENAKKHVKKYLIDKKDFYEDSDAQKAADEFFEFAKTRSIYFENNFTHKTFLEYFTAYYIFSNFHSKPQYFEQRDNIITKNLNVSVWSVVLELLICKIDKDQPDFEIIDNIIEKQLEYNKLRSTIFFLQIAKYLRNISPDKIKVLIKNGIEYCLEFNLDNLNSNETRQILFECLTSLLVTDRFKKYFKDAISEITLSNADKQHLFIYTFETCIITRDFELINSITEQGISFDDPHPYTYIIMFYANLLQEDTYFSRFSSFVKNYSISKIKNIYESPFSQKIFYGSNVFNWVLTLIITQNTREDFLKIYSKFKSLGVTQEMMEHISKKKLNSIQINQHLFMQLVTTKDKSLKTFIKNIAKIHSPGLNLNKENKYVQKSRPSNAYGRRFKK